MKMFVEVRMSLMPEMGTGPARQDIEKRWTSLSMEPATQCEGPRDTANGRSTTDGFKVQYLVFFYNVQCGIFYDRSWNQLAGKALGAVLGAPLIILKGIDSLKNPDCL